MISLKTKDWQIDNIDTVIFDKDGTLIDLHYFWGKMTELRSSELIKKFNLNSNKKNELCLMLGYDTKNKVMLENGITALYSRSKIIEIMIENLKKYNINATKEELENIFDYVSEIFYKNIEKYTKPINEAVDFFKRLYENNIKLAIVTSDSITSTNLTLKQFQWEKYFNCVIGRESTKDTKESGKPTLLAINKLNSKCENCIMIGDAPMDIISAQNAGINSTILVATGQINKDKLSKHSKYCLDSLKEIKIINS